MVTLLGGIALFLFGMSLMGEGLKKVAGSRLELVLYKLSSTPLKGVLLGTGVTAVIQSSSATSVMVVGFVNSGMMEVRQAIGVIMGAIVGTSVTGWILCLSSLEGGSGVVQLLSTEVLTGVVAVIGIILWLTYIIAIAGNMLPVPIIYLFARRVLLWGKDKKLIGRFFTFCLEKGEKAGRKLQAKAGRGLYWALLLFVGIPLPGTGAWTGTLAASLLDMDFKKSVLACMGGVLLAGIIMGALSLLGVSVFGG